jgi:hypothetical protein
MASVLRLLLPLPPCAPAPSAKVHTSISKHKPSIFVFYFDNLNLTFVSKPDCKISKWSL